MRQKCLSTLIQPTWAQSYELTVQVSNAAGTVSSAPIAMAIAEVPGTGGVTTPIDAELGGVAESGGDVVCHFSP